MLLSTFQDSELDVCFFPPPSFCISRGHRAPPPFYLNFARAHKSFFPLIRVLSSAWLPRPWRQAQRQNCSPRFLLLDSLFFPFLVSGGMASEISVTHTLPLLLPTRAGVVLAGPVVPPRVLSFQDICPFCSILLAKSADAHFPPSL